MKIISLNPDHPYGNALYELLDDYNSQFGVDTRKHEDFLFVIKDDQDHIIGGAQGRIFSDWLNIYSLFSDRSVKGIGTLLMDHVENYAKNKNCKGVHLTTFEFQAPEFYQKRGYEIYGEIENFAGNYKNVYMKKVF